MRLLRRKERIFSQTSRMWCLDTLSSIVGTVIGIILTFGVTFWIEYQNKKKDNMKINLMVIENIDEMNKACAESYKKIMESAPVLEEMIKLTPDKVATMPQDSVDYYFNSLPHPLFEVNNFARNLINSNFDIIRNSENYYFLLMVNHYYSFYDAMTEFYENYGPIKLNNDINEVLLEKGIQSGTMDNSSRWNLMEMAKSDRIKYYIRTYLDLFVPNLKNYMVYMSDISQKIFKLTDYEELKKIYENSSSDNNYKD